LWGYSTSIVESPTSSVVKSFGKFQNCKFVNQNKIALEVASVTNELQFENCEFSDNLLCGANVHGPYTNVVFTNCKFVRNGQIGTDVSDNASPTFENCIFDASSEAGINATKSASPYLKGCKITNNGKIGVSLDGTRSRFEKCSFKGNGQAALSCFGQDQSVFVECKVHKNQAFAGQIHQSGTSPTFEKCIFRKHVQSVTFIVIDHGVFTANDSVFEDALQPHFEIREGALVKLNGCTVGATQSGTGIQVHAGGLLELNGTTVKDNARLGIAIADDAVVTLKNSSIIGNGLCGLMTSGTPKLTIEGCKFEKNGQFAMQLNGGEITFNKCDIRNHEKVGVVIGTQAKVDYADNTFENNGMKDIYLNSN